MDASAAVMNYPRRDARDKLAGRTRYTVDRAAPRMLHAAVLRVRGRLGARILRLDRLGGRGDAGGARDRSRPRTRRDCTASASPTIRCSPPTASAITASPWPRWRRTRRRSPRPRSRRSRVETEPLPGRRSPWRRRCAPGAPLVHPDWKTYEFLFEGASRSGNVAWEATVVRGDTDAAFARAGRRRSSRASSASGGRTICPSSRAPRSRPMRTGAIISKRSTQVPWTVRNVTARVLQIPPASVRVTVPPVGGGFGLKFDCAIEPFAAMLAEKSGPPGASSSIRGRRRC